MATHECCLDGVPNMTMHPLPKRRLGRTGFHVSAVGLGGAHLGRTPEGFSDEVATATVYRALQLGVNLIDTAPMYGDSQRRVGLALETWFANGGQREDLILSTKTGRDAQSNADYSADATRRSVEQSLQLLRTDYLDIVHVHDPQDLEPVLGPGGALEALCGLKEQGVIRALGLGVRTHELHQRCMATGDLDVSLTYCDYHLLDQSAVEGVLRPAAAHDVGVLNGAAPFLRDLERELSVAAQTDWIQVASYGAVTASSGEIRLVRDISLCVRDRRVLIVDDIVDTGRTLAWLIEHIQARGAADVKSCALLDKPSRRVVPVQADYVGFTIPDRFVVGYGLDWNGEYRDLPYIGVMEA